MLIVKCQFGIKVVIQYISIQQAKYYRYYKDGSRTWVYDRIALDCLKN